MLSESSPALSIAEVAVLLGSTLATLRAELSALPEHVLAWHPAAGEWCVKETIGHIIEADRRGFEGRIRLLLQEADPEFGEWDQVLRPANARTASDRARIFCASLSSCGSEAVRVSLLASAGAALI